MICSWNAYERSCDRDVTATAHQLRLNSIEGWIMAAATLNIRQLNEYLRFISINRCVIVSIWREIVSHWIIPLAAGHWKPFDIWIAHGKQNRIPNWNKSMCRQSCEMASIGINWNTCTQWRWASKCHVTVRQERKTKRNKQKRNTFESNIWWCDLFGNAPTPHALSKQTTQLITTPTFSNSYNNHRQHRIACKYIIIDEFICSRDAVLSIAYVQTYFCFEVFLDFLCSRSSANSNWIHVCCFRLAHFCYCSFSNKCDPIRIESIIMIFYIRVRSYRRLNSLIEPDHRRHICLQIVHSFLRCVVLFGSSYLFGK